MPDLQDILALCGLLERGEIEGPPFIERFSRLMAGLIGCSRCGVWVFLDGVETRVLHCIGMFDATQDRMVPVTDIVNAKDGPYFETLLRDTCVIAPDARSHPATQGFVDDYLLPLDIRSLLDVCFSVNGVPFGMFSCEHIGVPMDWTLRQLQQLRQIGSRASLTLVRAAAAAADTSPGGLWDSSGPNRFMTMPLPLEIDRDSGKGAGKSK